MGNCCSDDDERTLEEITEDGIKMRECEELRKKQDMEYKQSYDWFKKCFYAHTNVRNRRSIIRAAAKKGKYYVIVFNNDYYWNHEYTLEYIKRLCDDFNSTCKDHCLEINEAGKSIYDLYWCWDPANVKYYKSLNMENMNKRKNINPTDMTKMKIKSNAEFRSGTINVITPYSSKM